MRRLSHRAAVVLALAINCQRGAGSTTIPDEPPASSAPAAVLSASSPASPAPSVAQRLGQPVEACVPGARVAPATLAATWPARLGQRVRMKARIDRAVDLMTVVVIAGGQRFAVVAGPEQLWEGEMDRTFTVMGSTTVALGGKVTMPQLLLEEECAP